MLLNEEISAIALSKADEVTCHIIARACHINILGSYISNSILPHKEQSTVAFRCFVSRIMITYTMRNMCMFHLFACYISFQTYLTQQTNTHIHQKLLSQNHT